ncbi:GGDEF domain-containing protein [Methylorubrum thiocyanatum]|uniref:diguanylate cyclase n=1 Tax=Methylorubrum thiocyanatum TaxID=47958 RepID=A0AA40VCL9_9HYPH|nr:GGDEF domain-containing protein [Methylorubrum thiocyanatum]MBA8913697.1 diguanylate cyclase (GGDEF)-like protein [Methylorubrum thiocyanatum]
MDVVTMLFMSLVAAAAAAGFLAFEWRTLRNRVLLFWSAGFAVIVLGSSLSLLRPISFLVGVWVANGLLVVAHLLFLFGVARFTGRRIAPLWWGLLLPWAGLLLLPAGLDPTPVFAILNSALVALVALRAAHGLLSRAGAPFEERTAASDGLGFVFTVHGAFYAAKALLVPLPGAFVSIVGFKGLLIQVSLVEGIVVEVLLALMMAAAVRRRREEAMTALAERDGLTGLFNRRAFESRAAGLLGTMAARQEPGALLLLDIDRFKAVNDSFGHAVGDRLLVTLAEVLTKVLASGPAEGREAGPQREAIPARLGGDEFVILVSGLDEAAIRDLGAAIRVRMAREGGRERPAGATVSIGAALFAGGCAKLETLTALADAALYEAKRQGRDRLQVRRLAQPAERVSGRRQPDPAPLSSGRGCCA